MLHHTVRNYCQELYLSVAIFLVLSKATTILTVRDKILRDPLCRVLPSLCCNLHHSHGATEVHLVILVAVVTSSTPGTHPRTCSMELQPTVARSMIDIPA